MKKALILSPFFYPEPISTGKYNAYLAKALVAEGYQVEIYCSHPIYPSWIIELSHAELSGCVIHRGGSWMRYPKNVLLRRALLELWYAGFCLRQLLIHNRSFDLVIPIFPPSLFALLLGVLFRKNSKIIGIVHDLQGIYAGRKKGWMGRLLQAVITKVERAAFNQCHHLVYLSEGMRRSANASYSINAEKTSVYYPFNTIDAFVDRHHLASLLPSDQINMVYSGALGEKQAPYKMLDFFLAVLEKYQKMHCYIFSQGAIYEALKTKAVHPRLHFYTLVAEDDLPELLLRSTVQFLPQESGTSDGSLPSKLPNILVAATKVLCVTDPGSELVDIIASYPKGEVICEWDNKQLLDCLERLLANEAAVEVENNKNLLNRFTKEGLVKHLSEI